MSGWVVGETVAGLYEVRQVHNQGGMGVVYRVHHLQWQIDLAVKRPRAALLRGDADRERFVAEAEAWVGLGLHPHVCACHYVRLLDGVPHVFAEYCTGGSIADAIRDGRLYRGEDLDARIIDLAVQMAWGLQHAHDHGLVHRDVKPANVLLDEYGTAKVTDFGLAKAMTPEELDAGLTVTRGAFTLPYASPEQVEGGRITRQTDVWSFAVAVMAMYTGGAMWMTGAGAAETLRGYRHDPSDGALPIPPEVADVLDACLQVDPARRIRTMAEIADALIAAYQSVTGEPCPRTAPQPATPPADHLVNHALSLLDLGRPAEAEVLLHEAVRTDPGNPYAQYNHGLLQWRAGNLSDDVFAARVGASGPRELLVNVHLERGDHAAARAAGATAEQLAAVAPDRTWTSPGALAEPAEPLAISRDGAHVLAAGLMPGYRNRFMWWGVRTGVRHAFTVDDPRTVAALTGRPRGGALSDDARTGIAWDDGGAIVVLGFDAVRGRALRVLRYRGDHLRHAAISGDGGRVVAVGGEPGLQVWDAAAGAQLLPRPPPTHHYRDDSDDPGVDHPFLRLFDPLGPPPAPARARLVAVDRTGRRAVTANADGSVGLWDAATGICEHVLAPGPAEVTAVAVSGDGRAVAYGRADGAVVFHRAAGDEHLVRGHPGAVGALALSHDGTVGVSAAADGTVRVWRTGSGRSLRTLPGSAIHEPVPALREALLVALDPAGRQAVAVTWDRAVAWTVPAGDLAPFVPCRPHSHADVTAREADLWLFLAAATQAEAPEALRLLREARRLPGHERDERLLAAWRRLGEVTVRGALRTVWEGPRMPAAGTAPLRLAVGPQPGTVVVGDAAGAVLVLNMARRPPRALASYEIAGGVDAVAALPDGAVLAAGPDGRVRRWPGGETVALDFVEPEGSPESVSMAVSRDGRTALTAAARAEVLVWDLTAAACVGAIRFNPRRESFRKPLDISSDGRLAVIGADLQPAQVWDLAARGHIGTLAGDGYVTCVRIGPGDRRVLVAEGAGALRLWERGPDGFVLLRVLTDSGPVIADAGWSPDGRFAASAHADNAVRLWDLRSGECVREFGLGTHAAQAVVFTADARFLVAGLGSGELVSWELDWELEPRPEPFK
ncbi:protein kinase [Dactylosporangium sp. NPDC051541]|uniref:protein kinase domain-containing protein n=1 Tax=Dactylosporangium sp. NPDC051541 TaxID=3363977 RepID=UPI0037A011BA